LQPQCPFCQLPPDRVIAQNAHAMAIRDAYPISRGHTLILLKRHAASFFETTEDEQSSVLALLRMVRDDLASEFGPAGFNIGINEGEAAGQTIPHLHIHIIPRYEGDTADPRGGVRWIFPERAVYWDEEPAP
jgi:diadenosine tetraphosphate (Ap4A) HIT family hydrolase